MGVLMILACFLMQDKCNYTIHQAIAGIAAVGRDAATPGQRPGDDINAPARASARKDALAVGAQLAAHGQDTTDNEVDPAASGATRTRAIQILVSTTTAPLSWREQIVVAASTRDAIPVAAQPAVSAAGLIGAAGGSAGRG